MKKLLCIALALTMVLGLAITAHADVASDPKVTLVMAEVNPLDTTGLPTPPSSTPWS